MDPHAADRSRAWILGFGVVLFWGLSFAATRRAVGEIPPATLAFLRFAIGLLVLWPLVRPRWWRSGATRRDHRDLFLAGLFGVTLAFLLENEGLARTTASHASLIVATAPLATALTEALLARRLPSRSTLLGFLLALGGVALVVGGDRGGEATLAGDVIMLSTVFTWVIYGFAVQRVARRHPVGWVTTLAVFWGTVLLLPPALVEVARTGWTSPSTSAWGAVLFLGVLCSGLAYLWWNRALQVLGVTTTNSLIYAIPLVAVAGGVVFLGEPLGWELVVGAVLVISGLALAHVRPRLRQKPLP